MNSTKILLVEDDQNLGQILLEYLTLKGFEAVLKTDGEAGIRAFYQEKFDLCLLDLMMPKKDGFTVAYEIRQVNSDIPIIFLTAKTLKDDVIKGFKLGGDDYITKPFSMEELLLRIQAILRRIKSAPKESLSDPFEIEGIFYSYKEAFLETQEGKIQLTTKENELLLLFFENLNQTVNRSFALKKIWKDDSYFNARSMDVYITKIRKYLRTAPRLKIITIHGEGFKLIHQH